MSDTSEDLLIIYRAEAKQWANYMRSVLAGPIPEEGICCYDVDSVATLRSDFLRLGGYRCKLLILSQGMLDGLCQLHRFFLARVLQPAANVVVLLCGVDSLAPLLELVPLKGEECLLISSEQDAQEYVSTVAEIVTRGVQTAAAAVDVKQTQGQRLEKRRSSGSLNPNLSLLVLPSRVPCESPGEVFILLRETVSNKDTEVEFNSSTQRVRVKPVTWNDLTLRVKAADFPTGSVGVTLYCDGAAVGRAHLQYYSTMGEVARLLKQATNPVQFMCQAFQVCSVEELDQILASSLMQGMPTGAFQGLQSDQSVAGDVHSEDIPTLLHFVAQHGLRDLASILLQCPGAQQALRTVNWDGQTPLELAQSHGHTQLHILLQETLEIGPRGEPTEDSSVYETMGNAALTDTPKPPDCWPEEQHEPDVSEDEEDPYAAVGMNDEEYDTILTSSNAVVIANRPPAPTPRPETLPTKEDSKPYIAQVFQKKMSQVDADTLYSLPTKQVRGRDSISSTYDTFVPSQSPGLDELIELQEQVKRGSLSVDEALECFSDWQWVQRGLDTIQQEKLQQLRASIINNREDDDSVYGGQHRLARKDKISIIHHTPNGNGNDCRRRSQPVEPEFYSKPLKGQNSNFISKADKQ